MYTFILAVMIATQPVLTAKAVARFETYAECTQAVAAQDAEVQPMLACIAVPLGPSI